MKQDEKVAIGELVNAAVNKYHRQYVLVGIIISIFEIYMIGRGVLVFDFTQWRRPIYMACYIVLLVTTLFCLVLLLLPKSKKTSEILYKTVYFYSILLIIWSAVISTLDAFGGHPPIVFMTVLVGAAALTCIRPLVFYIVTTPIAIGMCLMFAIEGDGIFGRSGFITNLIVFVIIAFFIVARQFAQNKRDYISMKHLENLSYHDQLTGAKNRQALHLELPEVSAMFYFGILDFDDFKRINDTFGHDFGDEALKKGAELLSKHFGQGVYRFGGDEFVVVTDARAEDISDMGRAINKELEETFPGKEVHMTGGFYCPKSRKENYEDYLKGADRVLYRTKEEGKGRFVADI